MKRLISFLLLTVCLSACSDNKNTLIVGTIAGPETELMEVAQQVAKKNYNLTIKIKTFSDYVIPNVALNEGSIDANVYQHRPFLEKSIKSRGYTLVAIGKTFIYPMGVYSKKITKLSQLKAKSKIAIPNDPSNEARALLLLQKAGLIKLNKQFDATIFDITDNPQKLQFKTINAAQLPNVLEDVSLAVINTNYAVTNGLTPQQDALFIEDKDSPYANLVVVRKEDVNNIKLKQLLLALHSQEVVEKAKLLFKEQAIQAW